MKRFLNIVLICTLSILAVSCNNDDDISEIFSGQRFKITGITYNGQKTVSGVSEFYTSTNVYWITFNTKTFQGVLQSGMPIEGTWNADGGNHNFSMTFGSNSSTESGSELCRMVYTVLKNATSYSGDKNVLKIKQDNDSFIELSSM